MSASSPYPTRQVVLGLVDAIKGGLDTKTSVDEAVRRGDADAASALLLALAVAGRSVEASQVLAVLPDLTDVALFPILVGACTGDRIAMLLDLVETNRPRDHRDSLALFLAVELLAGAPAPPRLLGSLRTCLRRDLGVEASILLALAATRTGDPDVLAVAKRWLPMAKVVEARHLQERLRHQVTAPTLTLLPERPPERVISGFTARRPVPKIGRNDPCPCGSGQKYKKCCAERDAERALSPSPLPGLTREEYLQTAGSQISSTEIDVLRPKELALIDVTTLGTRALISALRRASACHRWDVAERAMAALAGRSDTPDGDGEGYRHDLITEALEAGNEEVAQRQVSLLRGPADDETLLKLALKRPTAETLLHVERSALAGLREPSGESLFSLAYALLEASPALGIVVARASLSARRWLDSSVIVDVVEEARDRLGLPPGDPAQELYESLLDQADTARAQEVQVRGETAERDALAARAETLQDSLQQSKSRVADLERQLRAQQARLDQTPLDAPTPASAPLVATAAATAASVDESERRRLRARLDELKRLLTERNEERTALRKQLATVNDALVAESADVEPVVTLDDADAEDTTTTEEPHGLLVPSFASSSGDELRNLPAGVARKALAIVASLASADVAAWRQVKRMASAADTLLTCRVGIHHRVVFRVGGGELAVLSVVHRKDLDGAIRRHGRIASR